MNHNPLTDEDQDERRTERLLRIPVDQIGRYSTATILDWLDARREWRTARLRAACQTLRETAAIRERAHARLAAASASAVAVPGGQQ